jgi:hypothetical protein
MFYALIINYCIFLLCYCRFHLILGSYYFNSYCFILFYHLDVAIERTKGLLDFLWETNTLHLDLQRDISS